KLHGDELSDGIRQELLAAVTKADAGRVVLDLGRVQELSSSCIRPLLSLRLQLMEKKGQLILCGLRPFVKQVLTNTRLISTSGAARVPFETASDVTAAVATLQSNAS